MLDNTVKPSEIVKALDDYVIGQDDAKKTVAVAVYTHFRKIAKSHADGIPITKSNVLLIGPSGTGKTLLCETLSRILAVPFVTAEATSLAQSRYVNEEIEAILQRLVDKAGGDSGKAQQGIVFIDEIDKLKATGAQARAVSGESVQHALLKIMEGSQVKIGNAQYVDTTNILFICGGAFVGLDEIMTRVARLRLHLHGGRRQPEDHRSPQLAREADRPLQLRPDSGIHRAAADDRPFPGPHQGDAGPDHDRAARLHL